MQSDALAPRLPDGSSFSVRPEVLARIAELDEFKGAWRTLGRLEPERLRNLRRVATIESIGSSTRIEGARLTDSEVERLLSDPGNRSFATRDEQEVAGYAEVMEMVFAHWQAMPLTENLLRQLHRDLLRHSSKDERHRGEYKRLPNHVEAFGPDGELLGVVFATASAFETPRRMEELTAWLEERERARDLHPLLCTAIFVVVFLAIHPFQDGNGRLSRILTTLMLLRAEYTHVPYVSLESIIEGNKQSYYRALRATQTTLRSSDPNWEPWLLYFLTALTRQARRLEDSVELERSLAHRLPELSLRILELARERGRVTVAEATRATGASRHTVKDHISALTRHGHLNRHGAGRGTWYSRG